MSKKGKRKHSTAFVQATHRENLTRPETSQSYEKQKCIDTMTEDERLYLQFLQNNIARMNTNSTQAKGWCIAIVSALLAIFSTTKDIFFVLICLIPVVLFCFLDTKYLQQEHKFVSMYNEYVNNKVQKPKVYSMPINSYAVGFREFCKALTSWSIIPVYGLLLAIILCILFIFNTENKSRLCQSIEVTNVQKKQSTAPIKPVIKPAALTQDKNENGPSIKPDLRPQKITK